ncbi:MAG: hypothetical protein ACQKBY_13140, partial [Verrucomicrobiales bacterium]
MEKGDDASLRMALAHPNAHVKMRALRLLQEAGTLPEEATGSDAFQLFQRFGEMKEAADRDALIAAYVAADDDWSKSALLAAAAPEAMAVLERALRSEAEAAKVAELVRFLTPVALRNEGESRAAELVRMAAGGLPGNVNAAREVLQILGREKDIKPVMTEELKKALVHFLQSPQFDELALPLAARWDKEGQLRPQIEAVTEVLLKDIGNAWASVDLRLQAAESLLQSDGEKGGERVVGLLLKDDTVNFADF